MRRRSWIGLAWVTVALVTLSAGSSEARGRRHEPPPPLPSDSSFAAFCETAPDSLDTGQYAWLEIQRTWRAGRGDDVMRHSSAALTEDWHPHRKRGTDARFDALLARPYDSLTDTDKSWLIAEDSERRQDSGSGSGAGVLIGLAALAGVAYLYASIYSSPWVAVAWLGTH